MSKASNLAGFVPSIGPTNNLNVGIVTATSFYGDVTGNITGNVTGNIIGAAATFTGNVSIAGTLTYEDVTNVDSIGIITARSGIDVTSGDINVISGNVSVNTSETPTNLYVSGNAASSIVGLGTTDANTTLDFSSGNNFSFELTGSIVLENPTGVTTGQSGIILISQDGSGSRTVGFASHWDFPSATAPTLSTGANALDCLTYFVRNSTSIVTNSLIGIGTL
jgi:hypothetical protein